MQSWSVKQLSVTDRGVKGDKSRTYGSAGGESESSPSIQSIPSVPCQWPGSRNDRTDSKFGEFLLVIPDVLHQRRDADHPLAAFYLYSCSTGVGHVNIEWLLFCDRRVREGGQFAYLFFGLWRFCLSGRNSGPTGLGVCGKRFFGRASAYAGFQFPVHLYRMVRKSRPQEVEVWLNDWMFICSVRYFISVLGWKADT